MARKRAILAGAGQIAYVAGAVVVAYVIVSFASSGTRAAIWVVPLTVLLYFGPIGLAVLAVIAILLGLLLGLGVAGPVNVDFDVVYLVVGILAAIGVAVLNVFLLRRALARRRTRLADPSAADAPGFLDRAIGGTLFVLSGCAFVALCVMAGFVALTAHGVDTQVPETQAEPLELAAALTWWPGLILAVGGLAIWIVRLARRKRILVIAAVELVVMVALLVVLYDTTANGPGR